MTSRFVSEIIIFPLTNVTIECRPPVIVKGSIAIEALHKTKMFKIQDEY